jgi:hypothetical protein
MTQLHKIVAHCKYGQSWPKKVIRLEACQYLVDTIYVYTAPKSCQDLLDFGVTESGSYMIDPDGSGTGAPPFEVFCNFDNGKSFERLNTVVLNGGVAACHKGALLVLHF